jgi:hypothetical protein
MAVKTYDPKLVSVIVGGKIMSGFADGTYVMVERNEAAYALKVGVDGEGTRAKSNNRSGKITITLMNSSKSNDDLSGFALADELSNGGVVPCMVKDNGGTTLAACETGWVQKIANAELAKEANARTWVIETDSLNMFVGGN